MNRFKQCLPAVIGMTLCSAVLAQAPNEQRWQDFNNAAIEQHIMPNYKQLADSSAVLSNNIAKYCTEQSEEHLLLAQQAFKNSMQAWQQIQHIQFGPVTLLMRNFSLQYWPDKKNLGGRQLNTILLDALASEQKTDYDGEFFTRASVAVKGYPAIERMLFDVKTVAQLAANPSYCPLMTAIGQHIAQNTHSISNEWTLELENYKTYSEDDLYISAQEAATEILKALVEPIEAISDGKIAAPLGVSLAKMRWRKSESWRSEQSIANVHSNLIALQHLYSGVQGTNLKTLLIESAEQPLAHKIDEQFTQLIAVLGSISEPVNMQYTQQQFDQLLAVQNKLKRLSDNLLDSMKPLKISLGFNRRDGD